MIGAWRTPLRRIAARSAYFKQPIRYDYRLGIKSYNRYLVRYFQLFISRHGDVIRLNTFIWLRHGRMGMATRI